ncbi:YitT family protein [Carboxylicivirga sp. M1479]|uniref:YitT family protein n=1 Tax=Carboxylicivirga sp. M1479 TaxID=2594476 RepID=UPI0011775E40|nr:YitT family protein [Carboxylicivirga sp. M1479]TRX72036.1 YitT family protein [Carboxylicivirga sp. M1479]
MQSKTALFKELRSYVMLTIGLAIGTLGWTAFLIPAKIVGGGLTGIATIIFLMTGWNVGITSLIINIGLILLAMRILGASFGIKTIYCVLVFAGLLSVMLPLFEEPVVSEVMMNAIIGGILGGLGAGIVFVNGGSTGGVDIIAMIINKYKNISLGRLLLGMDAIIISSSFFLVQTSSIEMVVYGFVTMAVLAYTVDMVISGNKQTVQFFIISSKPEELRKSVIFDAERGLTILHGKGGYSGEDRQVLMVIARKNETQEIFKVVKQIDPEAFITVGTVMGVYGQGFDKIKI